MHMIAGPRQTSTAVPRALCALVALAAGLVGVIMVVAPSKSGTYFSWALGPPAVAAMVGGFYIASAIVFGWAAAREPWPGLHGLCVAVLGLSLPTLAATAHFHDVFDFGRPQALAWVVLFVASPTLFGLTLWLMRDMPAGTGPGLRRWARAVLAAISAGYAVLATVLWFRPASIADHAPFGIAGLGAAFVGSWAAFLAVLAAYAAVRDRWSEARAPLLALVLWPLCGLWATLLHDRDIQPGGRRVGYILGMAGLAGLAGVVPAAGRRSPIRMQLQRPTADMIGGR